MTPEEIRALPTGTILVDDEGNAHQINRPSDRNGNERWPGEVWLDLISDEYAVVLRSDGSMAHGPLAPGLKVVWTPGVPHLRTVSIWYESYAPDGRVWCGSSNPDEVVRMSKDLLGCTYAKTVTRSTDTREEWTPTA